MTVLLIARRSRRNRGMATAMIYCRVKLDGLAAHDFSTHVRVTLAHWDAAAARQTWPGWNPDDELDQVPPAYRERFIDNQRLTTLRTEIKALALARQLGGEPLTAQGLADAYLARLGTPRPAALPAPPLTIGGLIDAYRPVVAATYRHPRTRSSYLARLDALATAWADRLGDPAASLTAADAEHYRTALLARGLSRNYVVRHLQAMRRVTGLGLARGLWPADPTLAITLKKRDRRDVRHLTLAELTTLETTAWRPAMQRVADLFLFMVYTGLHYADAQSLKARDLRTGIDGRTWLFKDRTKYDDSDFFEKATQCVPLRQKALALIARYGGVEGLPKIANATFNESLKQLAFEAGLASRDLSTKRARKTFTDVMLNEQAVSQEAVATMLGHADTSQLKYYARVDERRVAREVQFSD